MKVAIHWANNQDWVSSHWINFCRDNKIPYKIVNIFDSDILNQVEECSAMMIYYSVGMREELRLFIRQLLFSLETSGKKVFPNFRTVWHYDDKLGQKYLLESFKIPHIPTHVFYQQEKAIEWAENTEYPKVFKLRNGASSKNVKLAKNKTEAIKLINQSFGKGFSHQINPWYYLKKKLEIYKRDKSEIDGVKSAIKRIFYVPKGERKYAVEQGYALFQDFIPNNDCDYRLNVIDGKCFGLVRKIKKGDFRASGSGMFDFNPESIPIELVKLAFESTKKLKMQSVAYDFLFDTNNSPLVIELSYAFGVTDTIFDYGYWDSELKFHPGPFNPYYWMVESFVKEINSNN